MKAVRMSGPPKHTLVTNGSCSGTVTLATTRPSGEMAVMPDSSRSAPHTLPSLSMAKPSQWCRPSVEYSTAKESERAPTPTTSQ